MKRTFLVIMVLFVLSGCRQTTEKGTEGMDAGHFRGVWLTNVDSEVMDSPEAIAEAMAFLAEKSFNVVFPVVWNDAYTLYPSKLMEAEFGRLISPRFAGMDPLQTIIEEGHKNGLKVIPWFEYGFAASYKKDGGFLLAQRPEWAARDAEGNLLEKNGFEWMNCYHPEVQEFILGLILEVVENYDVDGVQGDDRLPASPSKGGYSDFTRELYRKETGGAVPENYDDADFMRWKADKLNAFGKRIYDEVKRRKSDILVTWSPSVYDWSYDEYLQDWPNWLRGGYADLVIPQVYRYDAEQYKSTLRNLSAEALGLDKDEYKVIPGILMNVGDYLMDEAYLREALAFNREMGYQGEVFFFYEGLRKEGNKLGDVVGKIYKARKP